jgi:hypothetical protein
MDPFFANPQLTYQTLKQQSQLEVIKAQAKPALLAHKEARQMDHGVWFANEKLQNERVQVEGLLSRLATASDRLKIARSKNTQADLVEAIHAFFKNECKLDVVDGQLEGPLHWWQQKDPRLCIGCEQVFSNDDAILEGIRIENVRKRLEMLDTTSLDSLSMSSDASDGKRGFQAAQAAQAILDEEDISEEMLNNKDPDKDPTKQGIALGPSFNGNFMGIIELPKFAVWTLELQVVKRKPDRDEGQGGEVGQEAKDGWSEATAVYRPPT